MVSRTKENPRLYRELSEPFESAEEADAAVSAFFEALGKLRAEHGLPNVYVVISASMIGETPDEEQTWLASCHYGDGMLGESLTAWAYGREQGRREAAIGAAVKSAARAK